MRPVTLTWFILGLITSSSAFAWNLEPCSAQGQKAQERAAYRKAVETAAPGSELYTPHAFPKAKSEVVENFVYYHRTAFSDTPAAALPPADRHFFELLDAGQIRFEVLQVVNWNPLRCGSRKERAFYHVVRAFNDATGEEVLRASIEDNGHVARVRHKPDAEALPPIPSLASAATSAQARFGLQPKGLQYVAAWGTLSCDEVQPCVAFQSGAGAYLMDVRRGESPVFRIEAAASRLSLGRDLTPERRVARIESLRQRGQELVSLGFDSFSPAARLPERPRP